MIKNPEVEYSTDINFFLKEQITVWKSGNKYEYCSRLEAKCFRMELATQEENYVKSDDHIKDISMRIHAEILNGKHGEGMLVN